MPIRPPNPCHHPGCPNLTNGSYCEFHLKQTRKANDSQRLSSSQRGYDARWKKARGVYLRKLPLCVDCQEEGKVVAATIVDHIVPHRGEAALMWNKSNWQSLCTFHHNRKTAQTDGAFGR